MKRTPLRRLTPLRSSGRLQRKTRIRQRARKSRDRGELADPEYLAWLRTRPCRVPGCSQRSDAHHLRHSASGASLGAHVKDDRRAISLCAVHHREWLHAMPWRLRDLVKCDLRAWQDAQLSEQRAAWEARNNQQRTEKETDRP